MAYYLTRTPFLSIAALAYALYALVLAGPHLPGLLGKLGYHGPTCQASTKKLRTLCKTVRSVTPDQPVQAYHLQAKDPSGWRRWVFRHFHDSEEPHGVYNTITGTVTVYRAAEFSHRHLVRVLLHEQKHAWQLTHSPGVYLLSLVEMTEPHDERVLEESARIYAERNYEAVMSRIRQSTR